MPGVDREQAEGVDLDAGRASYAGAYQPLPEQSRRFLDLAFARLVREHSCADEGKCPGLARLPASPLERGEEHRSPLLRVAAHPPESPERGGQPERRRRIAIEKPL